MRVDCFPEAPTEWSRRVFSEVAAVNPRYQLDKYVEYPFVEMAAVAENFEESLVLIFVKRRPRDFPVLSCMTFFLGKLRLVLRTAKLLW